MPGPGIVIYQLVSALPSDEAWLEELRRDVYRELYQATWGHWDEDRHIRQFHECVKRGSISIIQVDGVRIGMIQLLDSHDAVEISEIQILASYQNQGIGTEILTSVIRDANQGDKAVRLTVALKNDKALKLYERLGFRCTSTSETHPHMEYRQ